jgi:pimeloyl-ACP methyl ester carboxylesterase
MSEPQRETMKLWDGEMSYLEWPLRAPALLFSHATGFNAQTYRTLLQPLSDRLQMYAIDSRGHGFTSLPALPGSAKDWIIYRDDTVRFLDGLDGRPMILAGHSMGATVNLLVALHRPDLVRALVMIEPVFMPSKWSWVYLQHALTSGKRGNDLAEKAERRRDIFESIDAAEDSYRGRGAFKTWLPGLLHDYLKGGLLPNENDTRLHLACTPAWEAETFRSTPFGVTGLSTRLRCPVTIIYGGLSTTCSDAEARRFAHNHAGTRRVRIARATHFLPMEYPDVVRSEIARIARIMPKTTFLR